MKTFILPNEERIACGFTHRVELTHADLTEATANTAQTIAILAVNPGDLVQSGAVKLVVPFEDTGDAAFNTCAATIGDGGSATRFLSSTELNLNGTEIDFKGFTNTSPYAYTVADTVDIVVSSMSAKSLVNLNKGELHIFLRVAPLDKLSTAIV